MTPEQIAKLTVPERRAKQKARSDQLTQAQQVVISVEEILREAKKPLIELKKKYWLARPDIEYEKCLDQLLKS